MKAIHRELLAGGAGAAAFLLLELSGFKWWVSLALAALVLPAVYLLVPRRLDDSEIEVAPGLSRAEFDRLVAKGFAEAEAFAAVAATIDDETAAVVREIGSIATEIFRNFAADPRDVTIVRDFADDHVARSLELVRSYARLSAEAHLTEDERQQLADARRVFPQIRDVFRDNLRKCREADIRGLRIAASTLNRILEIERPHLQPSLPRSPQ